MPPAKQPPSTEPVPAPAAPVPAPDAQTFTAAAWSAGDGPKQVPLAGLLADDPTLQTAELTHDEWVGRLADYLASPRP